MRGGERDPVTTPARLDPQCDRQMRLARAGRAQEHHVVSLGQKVELCQVGDRLELDCALNGEVEVIERPDLPEAGRLDAGI